MKSKLRQAIEQILESTDTYVFIDNRAKGHYRMKFVGQEPCQEQIDEIMKLPHVIKTNFAYNGRHSWYDGFCVFTDIRPSKVKVAVDKE